MCVTLKINIYLMIIKICARTSSAKPPGGRKYHFYQPVALTAFCPGSQIVHLGFQMERVDSQMVQLAFRMVRPRSQWVHLGFRMGRLGSQVVQLASRMGRFGFQWVHLGFRMGSFGTVLSQDGLASVCFHQIYVVQSERTEKGKQGA
jgi:hypothetical protein